MSDLATAKSFIRDIGGANSVSGMIYNTFEQLSQMFPHRDEPHKQWTLRRIKGWWNGESENVFHWQMLELFEAAAKSKQERLLLEEARREHAEFIQKTARLAALLEHQDEAFAGPQIEALRSMGRRVRGTRVEGE